VKLIIEPATTSADLMMARKPNAVESWISVTELINGERRPSQQ
jgi:hypothetical protein